jgi:hypothetical protein
MVEFRRTDALDAGALLRSTRDTSCFSRLVSTCLSDWHFQRCKFSVAGKALSATLRTVWRLHSIELTAILHSLLSTLHLYYPVSYILSSSLLFSFSFLFSSWYTSICTRYYSTLLKLLSHLSTSGTCQLCFTTCELYTSLLKKNFWPTLYFGNMPAGLQDFLASADVHCPYHRVSLRFSFDWNNLLW